MALVAAAQLRPACDRLIVVLGPESDTLAGLLAAAGVETVWCPDADAGLGHSLAAGVRATPDATGWLVALADMPFIAPSSYQAVATALRAGASLAACEFEGRRGHPVGFAGRWFEALSQLTGEQGAKALIDAHREQMERCPTEDPGVLWDVDRPEDLAGWSAYSRSNSG